MGEQGGVLERSLKLLRERRSKVSGSKRQADAFFVCVILVYYEKRCWWVRGDE